MSGPASASQAPSVWADAVPGDAISAIADRHLRTRVRAHRKLGAGSGNAAYLVHLEDREAPVVLRFSRGFREDVYETEAENYGVIASASGVRTPAIHVIDRTCSIAPVPFMVMEHLAGRPWKQVCEEDPASRPEIRRAVGGLFAALHRVERPASLDESIAFLALGLAQFAVAVDAGDIEVDLEKVAACEEALRADAGITTDTLSFCLTDGEVLIAEDDGRWRIAGVLDVEWAGFGNRLADVSKQVAFRANVTQLDHPVRVDEAAIRSDPFCVAYEAVLPIDYAALARLARYAQLSTWGLVVAEGAPPEKKQWIRETKLDLINRLIDALSDGA